MCQRSESRSSRDQPTASRTTVESPSRTTSQAGPASDRDEHALLTERQLAARWHVSTKKLQADRLRGNGCRFVRIGRCVRYRPADVLEHEEAGLRYGTSELRERPR
jgi:hypothetical protein